MTEHYVGLISGTSMDGIDAVVIDVSTRPPGLIAGNSYAFDAATRAALDQARSDPDAFPSSQLAWLDAHLGDRFADAALAIVQQAGLTTAEVCAIGSHGQTILHHVEADPPHTLQVGDPHRIAERTGIATVADFRRADVAAGGQGAPLAPLLHQAFLADPNEFRVVVNLGGIANLTLLEPGQPVTGFDTGPANCYLDLWYRRHHQDRFDRNGDWAAGGEVDSVWLEALMDEPYLSRLPPKSTGIEYFSRAWLEARLPDWTDDRPRDIQATLAEFSACSLARSLRDASGLGRLILCGGGVYNRDLIRRISRHIDSCQVDTSDQHGMPADFVEAMLFAWLAAERLAGRPIDTPSITGAAHPVRLGVIHGPHMTNQGSSE